MFAYLCRPLPAVLCAVGLGLSSVAAAEKLDPASVAYEDLRSGALLNLLTLKKHGSAAPRPSLQTILNGTVNNTAADTTAQDTQSETSIIDLGAGNLVGAFNDSGSAVGGANHFTGYAWSNNSGATWTDPGTLPASAGGDAGDPVLAYHKASNSVYFATLEFNALANIQLFKSADKGHTFGAPVNATPGFPSGNQQDKPWLTVDNYSGPGNGNIYLCWTRFPTADIFLTRSTDGGATFGPSGGVPLSSGSSQGCYVATNPLHHVYVFYYNGAAGDNKLFVRRSTDLGVTFAPAVQVADLKTTSGNGNLALNGGPRSNSFPHAAISSLATSPAATRYPIYVVYNDITPTVPSVKADIFYVRSLDNGATWSAPVRVNDDNAGDQFFPTVAFNSAGTQLMFSYYSRSQDRSNLMFHRRGRIANVAANGAISGFNPSFQLSPNTPIVIGQDPVINTTYMGDYDTIAGGVGQFTTLWSDNRLGNAFHQRQPDVRFARILAPTSTDLSVTLAAAPPSTSIGQDVVLTTTVTAAGAAARDVFANINLPVGLKFKSLVASAGVHCTVIAGSVGCSMGALGAGGSRIVKVTATGAVAAGTRTVVASATTSSADTTPANNSDTVAVAVSNGAATVTNASTGNIAVAINDNSTVDVPITVGGVGSVSGVVARVRLNHSFDSDLILSLIAPTGQTVRLAASRGGSGDNFGSGTNDCAGTPTTFNDLAATSIASGAAPFAGTFVPEELASDKLAGVASNGVWKLRVQDTASGDIGTVGCVRLTITRLP